MRHFGSVVAAAIAVWAVAATPAYPESFKDQAHLDAIVSEAQEIVNDALKSFDSAHQQREAR